jgi:hypothetical protein
VAEVWELPEELRKTIREDPLFFVYEGGSDGTFGHAIFLEDYGEWLPGASEYAAEVCRQQGIDW